MKVIIPVAGAGTNLRPHTHTQPKPLLPIAGKPILAFIIDNLLNHGIKDFIFVIGYLGDKIQNFVKNEYEGKINYEFVIQEPRIGLAHAISLCENLVKDEKELLISLGDIIIDMDFDSFINFNGNVVAVQTVDNPGNFGIAFVDEKKEIKLLIEKPNIPKSNLALVGLYKIQNVKDLFHSIDHLIENQLMTKNEYHLTDALMDMIIKNIPISIQKVKNWYDCGKKEVLIESNRILLKKETHVLPKTDNCVIIQPVYIHPSAIVKNSIIGPYVAIGEGAKVNHSILKDTIVGAWATLETIVLKNSIVGNDSTMTGRSQSINIGDSTDLDFNNE